MNIVSCDTHTGNDRVAKMRFEFELADPGHLDAVLRTIKQIEASTTPTASCQGRGVRGRSCQLTSSRRARVGTQ